MIITYVVVTKATGEIEGNCEYCGICHVTSLAGFSAHAIPSDHDKVIVQRDMSNQVREYDFDRKVYKHSMVVTPSGNHLLELKSEYKKKETDVSILV